MQASQIRPLERELKLMKVCARGPTAGLLGTVTGMLTTFAALSEGSGGDQTMSVAGGISEALVTTMTGLVIALPGLFFQYVLGRKFAEYRYFLDRRDDVPAAIASPVDSSLILETMPWDDSETTQIPVKKH